MNSFQLCNTLMQPTIFKVAITRIFSLSALAVADTLSPRSFYQNVPANPNGDTG